MHFYVQFNLQFAEWTELIHLSSNENLKIRDISNCSIFSSPYFIESRCDTCWFFHYFLLHWAFQLLGNTMSILIILRVNKEYMINVYHHLQWHLLIIYSLSHSYIVSLSLDLFAHYISENVNKEEKKHLFLIYQKIKNLQCSFWTKQFMYNTVYEL